MRKYLWVWALLPLGACGSITLPAAVQMPDGTAMMGTTTAAVSGGVFEVATADQAVRCGGTYDALDTSPTIIVPVKCTDGRYGRATVSRASDGMSGSGIVETSDGQVGQVAFGNSAGAILRPNYSLSTANPSGSTQANWPNSSSFPPAPAPTASASSPVYGAFGTSPLTAARAPSASGSSRVYTGNCPTPESLDAAGRRCGDRSAASRPGGYDGYGSWAATSARPSGGGTYVRSYTRKDGTRVSGHYRRSRR